MANFLRFFQLKNIYDKFLNFHNNVYICIVYAHAVPLYMDCSPVDKKWRASDFGQLIIGWDTT